jgi:hypothetical protein
MTHAIQWFYSTGIHDPAWVQAIAAVAVVALTFLTLIVIFIYAYDTHTLAKTSVQQISLAEQQRNELNLLKFHVANDRFLKVQADVTTMMQSIADGTFGSNPPPPIYPDNWPDVAYALMLDIPNASRPAIALGIKLRSVDLAVSEFFGASKNDERREREPAIFVAISDAADGCMKLSNLLVENANKQNGKP